MENTCKCVKEVKTSPGVARLRTTEAVPCRTQVAYANFSQQLYSIIEPSKSSFSLKVSFSVALKMLAQVHTTEKDIEYRIETERINEGLVGRIFQRNIAPFSLLEGRFVMEWRAHG